MKRPTFWRFAIHLLCTFGALVWLDSVSHSYSAFNTLSGFNNAKSHVAGCAYDRGIYHPFCGSFFAFLDRWSDIITRDHESVIAAGTIGLLIVTTALAYYTLGLFSITVQLAQEAKKAGGIAEQSMIASQRAFVFAKGFSQYWEESSEPSQEGQYCWRFRPQWENSGSTPTRDLALYTNCSLRDTPLPRGFAFHAATPSEDEIGRGLIPPKSMLEGGIGPRLPEPPVTPADIIAIQNGKKYLYLWGFALYRDVFSGDKAHITRFCWGITITGNPTLYAPLSERGRPGSLLFGNLHHIEGNCADDECRT